MTEKGKYVIVDSEAWLGKGDNATPMIKLTMLDIKTLREEQYSLQSTNPALVGIDSSNNTKVVEVEVELVKQFTGNTYKKRITSIKETGEVATLVVKSAK